VQISARSAVLYCPPIWGVHLVKLQTSTRQVEGVTIVDLTGPITLGEGQRLLHDVISDLIGKRTKNILLNLGGVDYFDSPGIGALVTSLTTVRRQGGELKLVNVGQRVRALLQIAKVYPLFDVQDNEAAAVASFH
jgi:anti-sigma B factor antagonist